MVVVDEFDDVVGVSLSNDVCFHLSILFSSFLLIQHQEWQVCKSDFNSCRRKWKCCCRCLVPNVQNSWIKPDVEPSYRILLHLMTFQTITTIPIWNWTFNVFINTEIDPKKVERNQFSSLIYSSSWLEFADHKEVKIEKEFSEIISIPYFARRSIVNRES